MYQKTLAHSAKMITLTQFSANIFWPFTDIRRTWDSTWHSIDVKFPPDLTIKWRFPLQIVLAVISLSTFWRCHQIRQKTPRNAFKKVAGSWMCIQYQLSGASLESISWYSCIVPRTRYENCSAFFSRVPRGKKIFFFKLTFLTFWK